MEKALKIMGEMHLVLEPKVMADLMAGKEADIEMSTPGTKDWQEFLLRLEAGPGPGKRIVKLDPWFNLDDAAIEVKNSVANDGTDCALDFFHVSLEESEDRRVGFTINPKQAKVLAEVLMNYVRMHEAVDALQAAPAGAV